MEPRAELERLVAGLCDGPPDPHLHEQLCALLNDHPALRDDYLAHLELHALLQWRGGMVKPLAVPARPASRRRVLWRPGRRLAVAMVLAAACLAIFFVFQPGAARATPDLLEQLVELNVDLAEAATPGERRRILDDQAERLKARLARAQLPPADRQLAESLLENGAWLVQNRDPMAEAERLGDLADELVARLDASQDEQRTARLAESCDRLLAVGIETNLNRAARAGMLDGERKTRLAHSQQRHARRAHRFAEIVARHPEHLHKGMRRHVKKK